MHGPPKTRLTCFEHVFGPYLGPHATPRHEILVHRRATIWFSSAAWGPRKTLCIDKIWFLSKLFSRSTNNWKTKTREHVYLGGGWRVPPPMAMVMFWLVFLCFPSPLPCRWCVPPLVDGGSAGGAPARRREPVLSLVLALLLLLLLLLALLLLFPYVILCFSAPSSAGAV